MRIVIDNDLFNIAKRLKNIDYGYVVVFDTRKNRYEVRHNQIGNKICFVVPYKALDNRTLEYARKTSIKNSKFLLEEIEKNNKNIENKRLDKIKDECEYKFREIYNFEKNSREMDIKNSYKTKWV